MKPIEGKEPMAVFVIEITPEQLRLLANQIETKQKQATEGQQILTMFTDKIMLMSPVVHNGKS